MEATARPHRGQVRAKANKSGLRGFQATPGGPENRWGNLQIQRGTNSSGIYRWPLGKISPLICQVMEAEAGWAGTQLQYWIPFNEHLLCSRHLSKGFPYIKSFATYNKPLRPNYSHFLAREARHREVA